MCTPIMTTREKVLEEAKRCVLQDRNNAYGGPEVSFNVIANLWDSYLIARKHTAITAADVAAMMILLKVARLAGNPTHLDSAIDVAGYAACLAEVAK